MTKKTNRRGCWLLAAAMVCAMGEVAAAQGSGSFGGTRVAPEKTRNRNVGALPEAPLQEPRLMITHCEASVRVIMPLPGGPKSRSVSRNFEVYARLDVPGDAAPSWCERFEIIELRDAAGEDLLAGKNRTREQDTMRRFNLAQQLANQYIHEYPINTTVTDSVRGLKELPTKLAKVKIRADLVTSRNPVVMKVPLKVMEEPMTLVPGVTVLVTKIEEQKASVTVWMEVRSRAPEKADGTDAPGANGDPKPGVKADLELQRPIFAGLVYRNREGKIGGVMPLGQSIELHNESIMVSQGLPINDQQLTSDGSLEVLIFDGMERVQIETTLENVELAEGGEVVKE